MDDVVHTKAGLLLLSEANCADKLIQAGKAAVKLLRIREGLLAEGVSEEVVDDELPCPALVLDLDLRDPSAWINKLLDVFRGDGAVIPTLALDAETGEWNNGDDETLDPDGYYNGLLGGGYIGKVLDLPLEKVGVTHVKVEHDDECSIFKGGECDCDPSLTLMSKLRKR